MNKKHIIAWTLIALNQAVWAKNEFQPLTEFIQQAKDASGLSSGTAVALIKDGKIVYQKNFGYSDIENNKPISNNTSFYVASTTKPFYALSTLIDIQNGNLKADDSLATLFPRNYFKHLPNELINQVTVKDLLVHGSGIDSGELTWAAAYTGLHDLEKRNEILMHTTKPSEEAQHGEFNYSNFGYNLLSVWHDNTQKLNWQHSLQNNVFKPLKMTRSTAIMSEAKNNPQWDVAKPYSFLNANKNEALYLQKVDTTMHSAGGMITSSTDMAQMVLAQLGNGKINGQQVLPEGLIRQSQTQQIQGEGKYGEFVRDGYAWGWFTGDYKGERMLHHLGGFAGTHALISFMPEKNVGVVILNNEDTFSSRMTGTAASIAYDILLDKSDGKLLAKEGLEKLTSSIQKFASMISEHYRELDARPWLLSNPKQDYTGTYQHPRLGTMHIELDSKGVFQIRWGQLRSIARPYKLQDSLRVELVMFSGSGMLFELENNQVTGLRYDGNEFKKVTS